MVKQNLAFAGAYTRTHAHTHIYTDAQQNCVAVLDCPPWCATCKIRKRLQCSCVYVPQERVACIAPSSSASSSSGFSSRRSQTTAQYIVWYNKNCHAKKRKSGNCLEHTTNSQRQAFKRREWFVRTHSVANGLAPYAYAQNSLFATAMIVDNITTVSHPPFYIKYTTVVARTHRSELFHPADKHYICCQMALACWWLWTE